MIEYVIYGTVLFLAWEVMSIKEELKRIRSELRYLSKQLETSRRTIE